jgi:hypothetical protein
MAGLALGLHSYHDTHGKFPPAVVYGKDRKALYSWRVLLLPEIGEDKIYRQFKLDEPWDSPHNIRLLDRRPSNYAPPSYYAHKIPSTHTYIHVFVGRSTAFESPEGQSLASFTDGSSNTFLLIEGGKPVPWSKPEDLEYAADRPLPELDGPFRDGLRVALADGSVHFILREFNETAFRAAITRNGGENGNLDFSFCPGRER